LLVWLSRPARSGEWRASRQSADAHYSGYNFIQCVHRAFWRHWVLHYTDSIFISRGICQDVAIELAYSDTTCETGCWTLDFLWRACRIPPTLRPDREGDFCLEPNFASTCDEAAEHPSRVGSISKVCDKGRIHGQIKAQRSGKSLDCGGADHSTMQSAGRMGRPDSQSGYHLCLVANYHEDLRDSLVKL